MATCWLLLDFPSIKSFVFGTEAAREIRGGSAILDDLNRKQLPALLQQQLPGKHDVVYAGGGSALVTFAEGVNQETIEGVVQAYQTQVRQQSGGGLRVEYHIAVQKETVKETLTALHAGLARSRYNTQVTYPRTHTGILRGCASCATGYATESAKEYGDSDSSKRICATCHAKARQSRSGDFWKEFIDSYQDPLLKPWDQRPQLEDICKSTKVRKGYFALVYGDGDAMGRIVKSIPDLKQYKIFSQTVDTCLKQATYDTLRKICPKPEGGQPLPADILLLGGDDLVMAIQVDLALPFALGVAHRFKELSRQALQKRDFFDKDSLLTGFSVSFGIAIAKEKQPFRIVLDQAESLLKSAKRSRSDRLHETKSLKVEENLASHEPYIDVADVSQSRFLDLKALRKEDLGVGTDEEWTAWPRSLSEARVFYDLSRQLLMSGFKKGRMHGFTEAMMMGGSRSVFETCRLLTRLPAESNQSSLRSDMVRFFNRLGMDDPPWKTLPKGRKQTAIMDLASLYPYLNPDIHEVIE